MSTYVDRRYWVAGYSEGEQKDTQTWNAWGVSWGKCWGVSWGPLARKDTHDGAGAEYWYKYWRKLHEKKKKEPTLEEIIEAVQESPAEALRAVPEAKKHFEEINYRAIRNNAVMQEFIARQILIKIELKRIEDEEEQFIEMLLLS